MNRFQNILVSVDTRFDDQVALEWGARLAEHNHSKLTVVEVLPGFSWLQRRVMTDAEGLQALLIEDSLKGLEALVAPLRERGIDVGVEVLVGKTSEQLVRAVERKQHDLVVRVTKGAHSQASGLFGTTSMRLLRGCGCAVWLVRPGLSVKLDRVLVAVDTEANDAAHVSMNKRGMELGESIVEYEGGELHVVHAWRLFASTRVKSRLKPGEFEAIERKAESGIAGVLDDFLRPYGMTHHSERVHLVRDELSPATAIVRVAKELAADLIVLGTDARSGVVGAMIGNTAELVLDHVECSVVTIKPPELNSSTN